MHQNELQILNKIKAYQKQVLLLIGLVFFYTNSWAQIKVKHYSAIPEKSVSQNSRQYKAEQAIALPFFDDFSRAVSEPDSSLWLHGEHVYVNSSFPFNPPNAYVATLDGLDRNGISYSSSQNSRGFADSLVSQPILLGGKSVSDNLVLSYFLQQKGFGRAPSPNDSLFVSFLNNQDEWIIQKRYGGLADLESEAFQQEFIAISSPDFLHDGFKIKFEAYNRLSGNFDAWHLGYIYLNEGRSTTQDWYIDRTMAGQPSSPFKNYTAIPYTHLTEHPRLDTLLSGAEALYNNLFFQPTGVNYVGVAMDKKNKLAIDTVLLAGNSNTLPRTHLLLQADPINPNAFSNFLQAHADSTAELEMLFFLRAIDTLLSANINGQTVYYPQYDLRQNDTVRSTYTIADYYAYDDGSAESSAELLAPDLRLAIAFENYGQEPLSAVDIFIPNIAKNLAAGNIEINVWTSIADRQEGLVFSRGFALPRPDSLNRFVRLEFEENVAVGEKFYIGYRQVGDNFISVGLDRNTDSSDKLFIYTGDSWNAVDNLEGSVMIRPVFKAGEIIASHEQIIFPKEYRIYPNPNQGSFYIEGKAEQIEAVDINGKKVPVNVISIDNNKFKISVKDARQSLIFIRIFDGRNWVVHKILIR